MAERAGMRVGPTFVLDVAHEADGRVLVVIEGDVDLHSGPELRDRLAAIVDTAPRQVVVDLSAATFLDSMALAVLIGAKRELDSSGARIDLVVAGPDIRRIFEITMLDRVFDLYESRAAATAAGGSG